MTIKFVAVHTLNKDQHSSTAICTYSESLALINSSTERLITAIYDKYKNKSGKGYGRFENDDINYPMSKLIPDYINDINNLNNSEDQSTVFLELSINIINHLKARAETETASTGGHVLISHIEVDNREHIIIAVITDTIGSAISNGQILDSVHVDLSSLKMAGNIDTTTMLSSPEDLYISFLKGNVNIAEYFKKFLGCNDTINDTDETKKLVSALKDFCKNYNDQDKNDFLTQANSYLFDLNERQEQLDISILANHLCSKNPDELIEHLSDEALQLSNFFIPNKEQIKGLIKIKINTTQWNLSFDRNSINNDVKYDKDNNSIILYNVPDYMRKDLINSDNE